jgi:hypothetical protein
MKIYSSNYSDMCESAQEAECKSYRNSEICNIACDTQSEYDEISAYLQNNEDVEDYVINDGVLELWGVRHMNIGNANYRVHVYVINPELNRF